MFLINFAFISSSWYWITADWKLILSFLEGKHRLYRYHFTFNDSFQNWSKFTVFIDKKRVLSESILDSVLKSPDSSKRVPLFFSSPRFRFISHCWNCRREYLMLLNSILLSPLNWRIHAEKKIVQMAILKRNSVAHKPRGLVSFWFSPCTHSFLEHKYIHEGIMRLLVILSSSNTHFVKNTIEK